MNKLRFGLSLVLTSTRPCCPRRRLGCVGRGRHVYVNDKTGENTVGAFDRHADGTVTPMRGSPFAAGARVPAGARFAGVCN